MTDNRITRRQLALAATAAAAAMFPVRVRAQQNYPNRPVRFILPFAAAGVADITARLAAEKLGDKLGQRFVVENQPGPGGIAAARAVLSQAPDGYTIGLVTNGTSISAAIYKALPFDPVKEFATVSTIGAFDLVFATNVDSEFKTLDDFIKRARARPGTLNVGTINVGGTQNLAGELLKASAGLNFQIIPYRRADRRGGGRSRLRGGFVERRVRSERHAGGHHRALEQGDSRDRGDARGEATLRRARDRSQSQHARGVESPPRRRHRQMGGGDRTRRHSQAVARR